MGISKKHKNRVIQHKIPRSKLSFGQKSADFLSQWGGSWPFIGTLTLLLVTWMGMNTYLVIFKSWDPYPFILLNLFLSCLATFQAPVILMSQNRSAERDRIRAEYDYLINRKAEREIEDIQKDLEEIKKLIIKKG
ncbi:DUF1003 domain-containing protein [Candidatus Woesearchaeota archaeon]|jgi:uncharacterized membrane protein|nr:DUF1003 domain-containing protein [Candidatus Woesearchaeota archaeon]